MKQLKIKSVLNPKLNVEGLLRTMFDSRNNLANEVSKQLTDYFGDKVYNTIIPRNVRLAEAPSYGQPIILYDKTSTGAIAYLALAGELMRKKFNSLRKLDLWSKTIGSWSGCTVESGK